MRFRDEAPAPGNHEWRHPLNAGQNFYLLARGSTAASKPTLSNTPPVPPTLNDDDDLQPPARVDRTSQISSREGTGVALSHAGAVNPPRIHRGSLSIINEYGSSWIITCKS
ncbi:unnamed protein product [Lasius platythorax]|uniref:Uncharacterized protein n=1 Tax=Lasius platythorax TaxID=488582 RepID=A0AAV2PB80_9HYME